MTSATDTRTPHPTRWRLYLARTGEALEVEAPSWQDAIHRTARPDACVIDPDGPGPVCLSYITAGTPASTSEPTMARALASVLNDLEGIQRASEVNP